LNTAKKSEQIPLTPGERLYVVLGRAATARRELVAVHDVILREGKLAHAAEEIGRRLEAFNKANAEVALTVFEVLGVDPMATDAERDLALSIKALVVGGLP